MKKSSAMALVNNSSSSHHRKSKKNKRHKKSHKSEKTHKKYKKAKKRRHQSGSSVATSDGETPSDSENIPEKNRRITGSLNARFTELARLEQDARKTAKMSAKADLFRSTDPAAIVKEITKTIQTKIKSQHTSSHVAIRSSSSSEESAV